MPFTSGTVEAGPQAAPVCMIGAGHTVAVKNLGADPAYLGGADVDTDGYPLAEGESQVFAGPVPKDSPLVPAPSGDPAGVTLYACTDSGASTRIAWIGS